MANVAASSADEPSPGPLPKRESKPAVPFVPNETLRDQRQPDGKRRPDAQPSPSPSPQQPRPMTSLTSLQLWLNKPKIDQRVQELERQIGQIALGEAGQDSPELHEFLVTLVTQLFEAEAQAKKADKKEAQATAALLATVQAQRENTTLESSTKATIDALVGEGFNAPRTLRDHVKRWADMISAEYAGDTLRQAQLAKALAERLSATPDLGTEQQREDQVRKAIIGSLQTFFDTLKEAHEGRYTNDARAAFHNALMACALQTDQAYASFAARAKMLHVRPEHLSAARARWERWMGLSDDNEFLTVLRSKVRSDKIDDALCEFIVKAWCDTDVTRESEVAKDRVRNPAHHDGEKHRIRYLETTYNEACAKIQKMIETNFTGQQRRTPVSYDNPSLDAILHQAREAQDIAVPLSHAV